MSTHRHPRTSRSLRVALLGSLVATTLLGCSSAVEVDAPRLDADDEAKCAALVADAPDTLFGQERRDVTGSEVAVAWGDPPVVLECGAEAPDEFDAFSACSEVGGVGWFMPADHLKDVSATLVITAQSHRPRVSVTIPAEHRQNEPDTHLLALGELITSHLTETAPCH